MDGYLAAAAGHFQTEALGKHRSFADTAVRTVPLQRLGRPEEHAWMIALLASPLGRAFSGAPVTLAGARDSWFVRPLAAAGPGRRRRRDGSHPRPSGPRGTVEALA